MNGLKMALAALLAATTMTAAMAGEVYPGRPDAAWLESPKPAQTPGEKTRADQAQTETTPRISNSPLSIFGLEFEDRQPNFARDPWPERQPGKNR
ncbi:MAG: hypothetical protein AAF557_24510 [Pseudomonadota bacterium]